uniref:RNase H type-1 domain-containing protein n=1 Tax=Leptobrachium leishanense TaxID=445787 RepID=A0A8C5PLS3_9ANUR
MTVHAHGALYKERGLLTSSGQQIKYAAEIAALLEAVWKPSAVSIMHCCGHQKGHDEIPKGNRRADQAAKAAAKPLNPPDQISKVLLCKQEDQLPMPNYEFYMNWRKFEPKGEFIETILHKWHNNYELLEENHDYIQWLFPTWFQEVQQRLRRAYRMMLKFFGVKIVGGDEENIEVIEVERAENFTSRFDNLTANPHNNLRITRVLLSLGELGAEEYQAPLVRFFLKETLNKIKLPRMKKSKRQDLLFFAWRYYFPKEEFMWGNQEELAGYKAAPVVAALLPAPLSEWKPVYSEKEKKWLSEEQGGYGEDGWFQLKSGQIGANVAGRTEIVRALHMSSRHVAPAAPRDRGPHHLPAAQGLSVPLSATRPTPGESPASVTSAFTGSASCLTACVPGPSSPKSCAVPRSPKSRAVPRSPKSRAVPRSPKSRAVPRSPKSRAVPRSPKSRAVPRSPKSRAVPRSPKSRAVPRSPKSRAVPRSPKSRAVPRSPLRSLLLPPSWRSPLLRLRPDAASTKSTETRSISLIMGTLVGFVSQVATLT